jgi:alpha-tubulin suppressor-like RCC1 family protein
VSHACALASDQKVYCWGSNLDGQLGFDTGGQPVPEASPVQGLPDVVHVDASAFSNCAIDEGGGVWCWGKGNEGQLGNGELGDSTNPVLAFDACP